MARNFSAKHKRINPTTTEEVTGQVELTGDLSTVKGQCFLYLSLRIYILTVTCTDDSENSTSKEFEQG